jgi:hypothetical protein
MPLIRCTDDAGAEWEVFEVVRTDARRDMVRDQLANGWLCFQRADGYKVRVAKEHYPTDWSNLPADAVLAILASGVPVVPRVVR